MKYDVYDNAAHAWVEAYIDGYGWVIVDATPGYGEVSLRILSKVPHRMKVRDRASLTIVIHQLMKI